MKLADMGLSKVLPYTIETGDGEKSICHLAFTMCGTPEFLAPEYIFSRGYDHRVDWWAFGCVVYEMLFGMNPFERGDLKATFTHISNVGKGQASLKIPEEVQTHHPAVSSFLKELLCNQDRRLGSSSADDVAYHQFYGETGFDWKAFDNLTMTAPVRPTSTLQERYADRSGQRGLFYFDDAPEFEGDDSWCDNFCT
jgi:serine/threonine protein kinase